MPLHPALLNYIEWFTAVLLLVGAVSHILHPRLWANLFIELLQKPYAGLYVGSLTLPLGLAIALGHNVWGWHLPVIVTVIGWGWTIKGTLYLVYPELIQRVASRHMQHPERFVIAGAVMLAVALLLIIDLLR